MGRHGNVICILRPTPQQRKYVHRRSYGHELSLITNSISGVPKCVVCVPEPPILVRGRVYGLAMSNVRFVTSSVGVGRLTWRLVSFVGHDITF